MTDRVIARAKVSDNMTIALVVRVRGVLGEPKAGDYLQFRMNEEGELVIEKESSPAEWLLHQNEDVLTGKMKPYFEQGKDEK